MRNFQKIIFGLFVIGFIGSALMHAETENRRKARYYYAAGIQAQARNSDAEAYEYFKKSYQADPSYPEAAQAYGQRRLYNDIDTLQTMTELERSLEMMRPYVDLYPEDVYEAQNYGYVAGKLRHTEDAVRVLERTYELRPESSLLLQLSDAYAQVNDLKNAVEAIDRYERQEGLNVSITTRKMSYLLADNDTLRALNEARRLIAAEPEDASFRILLGNLFDIIEQPDSALKYYKLAESIDPESGDAKLALAGYYAQIGDSTSYDTKVYELLLTEDFDVEQKTALLADYLQTLLNDNHDFSRGDHLFEVLRSQYPHEPRVLDLAARYSAAKGNFDEAVDEISYALDQDPDNATFWGQLMTYRSAGSNPEKALETYDEAIKHINPDDSFKLAYASIAQMLKKYDKAAEIYEEMITEIDSCLVVDSIMTLRNVRQDITMRDLDMLGSLFTLLGDVLHEDGNHARAYTSYENAIVFDSGNNMAKNNYAYFLSIDGGDLEKALKLSGEVMEGNEADNPTYIDTYAWINYKRGDYATARQYQEKAIELLEKATYPSPEIYEHYGDILAALGNFAEAVEAWKKAVQLQEEYKMTDEPSYQDTLKKIKETETKLKNQE